MKCVAKLMSIRILQFVIEKSRSYINKTHVNLNLHSATKICNKTQVNLNFT